MLKLMPGTSVPPRQLALIFQEMADASSDVFWIVDDTSARTLYVSPAFDKLWGRPREQVLADPRVWTEGVHPEDRERADALFKARHETGRYDHVFRVVRPDGSIVWVRDRGWAVRGDGRDGPLFVGIAEDVTAAVQNQQHQEYLMNEVDHRAKNNLAIIQSIMLQSKRSADTVDGYADAVLDRIQSISRTHDLLRAKHWRGAMIAELAADELAAYRSQAGCNLEIDGPPLTLSPKASAALSLTLHELATNAAKYGSLSVAGGRIRLAWSVDFRHDRIILVWEEADGPEVVPPRRRGFGTKLIERMIGHQLDGAVDLAFEPGGIVCRIDIPARHRLP